MNFLRSLLLRLKAVFRKDSMDRDMAEQMQHHLDLMTEENLARGMTPSDARNAALRKFGGVEQLKEKCRDESGVPWIEGFLVDLRYAFRMLRRNPAFSLVVVLSMALGIGANSAVFSRVNDELLRMLPVKEPKELVMFQWVPGPHGGRPPSDGGDMGEDNLDVATGLSTRRMFSWPCFKALQSSPGALSEVFACAAVWGLGVQIDGKIENVSLAVVASGNFYDALGVQIPIGRGFLPEDDRPNAPAVAVISRRYWMARFAGNPAVLGKTVLLNRTPVQIVGVTGPEFRDPFSGTRGTEYTLPLSAASSIRSDGKNLTSVNHWWLRILGRLKPGATIDQARAGFEGTFEASARQTSQISADNLPRLRAVAGGYGSTETERHRQASLLKIEAAITALILAAACVNVANLLLARGTSRRREFALRIAMGASRARVVRQLLTESLLLSFLGAVVSLFFAWWGCDLLSVVIPDSEAPQIDWRVVGVSLGLALLAGLAFGLAPAVRATRLDLNSEFQGGTARFGSSRSWLSRSLLVCQVAISFIVIVGAALAVQTVQNLRSVDVGFNRSHLTLFPVDAGLVGYSGVQAVALDDRLVEQLARLDGVTGVTYAAWPHLMGVSGYVRSIAVPGSGQPYINAAWDPVAANFFEVSQIPLFSGRGFTSHDGAGAPSVAIVNRTLARKLFGDGDPVGRRIGKGKNEQEIVGVVGDVRNGDLRAEPVPTLYTSFAQNKQTSAFFVLRAVAESKGLTTGIQRVFQTVDANLPRPTPWRQEDLIDSNLLGRERMLEHMSVALGLIALALACVGLYGLLSYSVFMRTREIGIRMALGALPKMIHFTMLSESVSVVAVGALIGIGGSLIAMRSISHLLYGLPFFDPLTYVGVAVLLFVTAAVACWLPARRAARVDPMVALRVE